MRIDDLDNRELLELEPEGGPVRYAGQRALLLDPLGMGLLRRQLIEALGLPATRDLLTRVGFARGWRLSATAEAELAWDRDEDRRRSGPRLLAMGGLFRILGEGGEPSRGQGIVAESSYEAEQHLAHLGRSDVAACWTTCGLLSGYLSRAEGRRILVVERGCVAKGDAACHFEARPADEWGADEAEALRPYGAGSLEEAPDAAPGPGAGSREAAGAGVRRAGPRPARPLPAAGAPPSISARSETMRRVVEVARRVAKVGSTVLITGESGTGKERFARFIHEESARAAAPMVAVNCGAITETLLEAELFGHARGAFTGATQDRAGLFETAGGGTLFLDEVGETSPGTQVKLLRALQEREIRRVGESRTRAVDVRVIAATNRDLAGEVARGAFRKDLYYRLRVVELTVPPLRERREDILPLARTLLESAAARMASRVTVLSPAAADQLLRYAWPGNVRELENAMERAVALARGTRVELDDLPEEVLRAASREPGAAASALDEIERAHILAVLARNGGNQTRTAEQLRIGTATLYRKLKRYGVGAGRRSGRDPADRAPGARER